MENYWTAWCVKRVARRRVLQGAAMGAAGTALVAVGCGGQAAKPSPGTSASNASGAQGGGTPKLGGTFQTMPINGNPPHLDIQQASSVYAQSPVSVVMDRLMNYKMALMDPKVGSSSVPVAGLALSTESPDAITWAAKLRTDVKWHNVPPVSGRLFVAEDVKASFTRLLTVQGAVWSSAAGMIDPTQISTPDEHTVVFRLKYPFAPFPAVFAAPTMSEIFPREALAGSYDPKKQVIGTGPFLFDHYTPDVEFVTKKNPDYYEQGRPYVDGTRSAIIPDQAQRLAQFIAGHLDAAPILSGDIDAAKKSVPGAQWLTAAPTGGYMIWFQLGDPTSPFQDIRIRRAFSVALDRDVIGKVAFPNDYILGFNPSPSLGPKEALTIEQLPPSVAPYYKYNPAEAKKLLEAAGASNMSVIVDYAVPSVIQGTTPVVETVNAMLNAVGLKSVLRQIDYTAEYQNNG